jgi:hypothetical protein
MQNLLARVSASKLSHAFAALAAAVLAVGVTIVVGQPTTHHHMVTVHVGGKTITTSSPPTAIVVHGTATTPTPTKVVQLTPTAQSVATNLATGAVKGTNDLKPRETPSLPPLSGPITSPVAQLQPPFAADSVPGCRTRFLTTNWSARASGIRVGALALHYTAGPDIPNSRADVDGLTAFGNNPSSRVSWALNMDKDGNCDYNVPFRYKAWTIAGLNSATVDIEVAGKGDAPYLRAGGYRELARIWVDFHRSYPYIPLRLGAVSNCNMTRTGIITHWMGGPCSGGHVDIKPLDLNAVISTLRTYVAKIQHPPVGKSDRLRCARLNHWRAAGRPSRYAHPAVLRKHTLIAHHVICEPGKPARR